MKSNSDILIFSMGFNSYKKEFAPLRANSFLLRINSIRKEFALEEQINSFLLRVNSIGKEFAPLGANSFLLRVNPHFERVSLSKGNQKATKVVSLCKYGGKHVSTPIHPEFDINTNT